MTRRAFEARLAADIALAVGCSPERFMVMLVTDMSESSEVVVLVLPSSSSSSSSSSSGAHNSPKQEGGGTWDSPSSAGSVGAQDTSDATAAGGGGNQGGGALGAGELAGRVVKLVKGREMAWAGKESLRAIKSAEIRPAHLAVRPLKRQFDVLDEHLRRVLEEQDDTETRQRTRRGALGNTRHVRSCLLHAVQAWRRRKELRVQKRDRERRVRGQRMRTTRKCFQACASLGRGILYALLLTPLLCSLTLLPWMQAWRDLVCGNIKSHSDVVKMLRRSRHALVLVALWKVVCLECVLSRLPRMCSLT
jgi:hypothetical protein